MKSSSNSYTPALRYHSLTRLYDPLVRITTREKVFKQTLVRQAHIQGGQRILDLGCGTGTLAVMAKHMHPGVDVVGLDADPEVLNLARGKLQGVGVEVRLDQGLASALPYPADWFDRVISSLFFHHLSSEVKREAMGEVFRVLRPGGEFHIADWGKPANAAMRLAFLAVQILDGFATTQDNVKGLLPDLLKVAGFEKVETTGGHQTLLGTLSLYRATKPAAWTGVERRQSLQQAVEGNNMRQERSEQPRVIVADDHPGMLDAVAQQLQSDYEIIARVGDGVALVESTVDLRPNLLVTDISMPKLGGLEGLRQLRRLGIETPVVILTACEDEELVNEALSLGVKGFVFKSRLASDLQLAVREVLAGGTFVSDHLRQKPPKDK